LTLIEKRALQRAAALYEDLAEIIDLAPDQ
jgi:hypothetical protein